MNGAEFTKQIERLRQQWTNAFTQERAALLWQEVQHLPAEIFAAMVDHFIGESRQAPVISDFRAAKAAHAERTRQRVPDRWDGVPRSECDHCMGLGVYICEGPEGADYAFRCHCPAGERDPRRMIPQFKQAHADNGYRWKDMRKRAIESSPMLEGPR